MGRRRVVLERDKQPVTWNCRWTLLRPHGCLLVSRDLWVRGGCPSPLECLGARLGKAVLQFSLTRVLSWFYEFQKRMKNVIKPDRYM